MHVLITGATGFTGSHTARAIAARGHRVRLFVRSPEKVARVFSEEEAASMEIAQGDITDAASVNRALKGVDALVHTAALVAINRASADAVHRTNLEGTKNVLGGGVRAGLKRIVHVSSASALFAPGLSRVDEATPLAKPKNAYGRSKSASDEYAQSLQRDGAPLHISYPAAIIGPDDPGESEGNRAIRLFARTILPRTSSGFQAIDVRDLAEVHAALLEYDAPGDRFVVGGRYAPWAELAAALRQTTGGTGVQVPLPGGAFRVLGYAGDLLCRVGIPCPLTVESAQYATQWAVVSNEKVAQQLGVTPRPLAETLRDTFA